MSSAQAHPPAKRRRKHSLSPPAPRKKSCDACRKAKSRCSETLPKCSRCVRKGFDCNYDGTRHGDANTSPYMMASPEILEMLEQSSDSDAQLNNAVLDAVASTNHFLSVIPGTIGGDSVASTVTSDAHSGSSGEIGTKSMNSKQGESNESASTASSTNGNTQTTQFDETSDDVFTFEPHQCQSALPFRLQVHCTQDGTNSVEITPNPEVEKFNPRFVGFDIQIRSTLDLTARRSMGAYMHWTSLMANGSTLPPFIHPHYPTLNMSDTCAVAVQSGRRAPGGFTPKLPESLANCSAICTMFWKKTTENTPFVWKNIKREQERIYESYMQWNTRDVLTSFQAILIYTTLRFIDGENEHNDFDMAFVLTLSEMGIAMWSNRLKEVQTRTGDPYTANWVDWMLAESACRSTLIFHVLFILLQLYRAMMPPAGCKGLHDLQLPCGKRLWHAQSYTEWVQEYRNYQAARKSKRVLRYGDLIALRKGADSDLTPDERDDLIAWTQDLDEFGKLVLISALESTGTIIERSAQLYPALRNAAPDPAD